MPPRAPKRATRARRAAKPPKRTDDYRHPDKRPNNPEAGLQSFDRKVPRKVRYEYDPHLDPQLVWASKAEHTSFEVDTVSLHIHERISTQAILKTIQREDPQRNLFGDPQLPLDRAVQFYQHGVDWANRLILGDSLLVMNSMLHREMLAEKVQMIYVDPPYGVAYNSNFQPRVDRREVLDAKDDSLTREPEQVKAYRDTWTLGVHSYLTYLRDRILLARELLSPSGSVIVQIGNENLHLVRNLLDESLGSQNSIAVITFKKTAGQTARYLPGTCDYLLWYAKDIDRLKHRVLLKPRNLADDEAYAYVQLADGFRRRMTPDETRNPSTLPSGARVYRLQALHSQRQGRPAGPGSAMYFGFTFEGRKFFPPGSRGWTTTEAGMKRLQNAGRLAVQGNSLAYIRYLDDFPAIALTDLWSDTQSGSAMKKSYVVQTNVDILKRSLLMTTDPGDLVFDPTCGSGTTAFIAEQWGRRWITCDTSRVALALARQRLMAATFPYYRLAYPTQGVAGGFVYEEVPHITLKSIAQNLPSEKEKLYDKPEVIPGIVRVSGPFTVEAINTLDPGEALAFQPVEERARKDDISHRGDGTSTVNDHIAEMTDLLKRDGGINVPGKGRVEVEGLGRITSRPGIHAEGEIRLNGKASRLAVTFGPRYGPVTARLVEEAIQAAVGSYKALAVAGFSFDPEVSAFLDKSPPAGLRLFRVQIAPDVLVGDLLKTRRSENLFAVIGEPDFDVRKENDGYVVTLTGVDIYDPNKGEVVPDSLEEIAAWFVDHDYDGRCFCVCQAFLPAEKGKAFEKLQRALKGAVDEEAWEAISGFESRPFKSGAHKCVAVKVIDVRGNEVVGVRRLTR